MAATRSLIAYGLQELNLETNRPRGPPARAHDAMERAIKKYLTATALAAMLALNLGGASPAFAIYVKKVTNPTGDQTYSYYDDDGKLLSTHVYDKDNKYLWSFYYDSDPNPEGNSSASTTNPSDVKDAVNIAKLKGGGPVSEQKDFFETPTGKIMVETGKTGLIVPYHNPVDAVTEEFEGDGGGSGGPDLNGGGIGEQINGSKHKGHHASSDEDDDDDGGPAGIGGEVDYGGASASKEIVNPMPVQLPAAKAKKAAHAPKAARTGKVDALLGKLPSPTKTANASRLAHGRTALKRQPAAAMHLPSAVGGVSGRTTAPTPLGLAGKLR